MSAHANSVVRLGISISLVLLLARTAQPVALVSDRTTGPQAVEASFWADNEAGMARMMRAMAINPTGDIDRDFVAMMVPHHQGAIDMAQALLRHGANERLRRLAQEIIVTQQQEIVAMRGAVGDALTSATGATSPTAIEGAKGPTEMSMPHHR
jgi:hypothetical protein